MASIFHITNGDGAGESLAQAGLQGEVFVWRDVLYDGPRCVGWPDEETLNARAEFLEEATAGGLDRVRILKTLRTQYDKLAEAVVDQHIVLWFDACLFDQAMLAHILACLQHLNAKIVKLICVDAFPGIEPFHGLGQLQPYQLASLYDRRKPVSANQLQFAVRVDKAFATQDIHMLTELSETVSAPLPWVPNAVTRWLQEFPDPATGQGRLATLALAAIHDGCKTPREIYASVAAEDAAPQFWGDTTLWAKINTLAERESPLVKIDGPAGRLPQWESDVSLDDFRITPLPSKKV